MDNQERIIKNEEVNFANGIFMNLPEIKCHNLEKKHYLKLQFKLRKNAN
jgi:hypothetical protein